MGLIPTKQFMAVLPELESIPHADTLADCWKDLFLNKILQKNLGALVFLGFLVIVLNLVKQM